MPQKPHLICPAGSLAALKTAIDNGADAVYMGFRNDTNARNFAGLNFDEKGLVEGVRYAHQRGRKVLAAINTYAQMGRFADWTHSVDLAAQMGADAVIVADLVLIVALRAALPALPLHVSSVASCRNSAGVAFYRDLGVRRVILPRDVTLDEITVIAAGAGSIEIEAFVLNDGCVFEEGVCHSVHLPAQQGGPICIDKQAYAYRTGEGADLSPRVARRLRDNDSDYQRWLWYRFGCGFSTTPTGYPYGPCGLCAVARLHAAGVTAVKIAGREGPTARKLKSVEMVKTVVDRVELGATPAETAVIAIGLRQAETHCHSGYMCYYP